MARLRSHIPFIVIALLAFLFRIYLWKKTGVAEYGDMLRYDAMAMHVVWHGYLGNGTVPDAFVTPGYPLFVAIIMKLVSILHTSGLSHQRLIHEVYLAQQVLSIITLLLIYMLGTVMVNKLTGVIAALLSLFYLPNSFVGLMLLTEALFIPLLIATILAFVFAQKTNRRRYYALSGFLLGLTTLVRPTVLPLLILFAVLSWWPSRRMGVTGAVTWLKQFAWCIVLFIVTMMPWWVRNALDFHRFIPLSTEAGNPLLAGADPYFKVPIDTLIQMSRNLHESQQTFAIHYIEQGLTHHFFFFVGWFLFGKLGYLFWQPWLYGYMALFVLYHHVVVVLGFILMFAGLFWRQLRTISFTTLALLLLQLGFLPTARYGYPIIVLWLIILAAYVVQVWHIFVQRRSHA